MNKKNETRKLRESQGDKVNFLATIFRAVVQDINSLRWQITVLQKRI
jgi:hypothetical protein